VPAHQHHQPANHSHHCGRGKRQYAGRGEGTDHIGKQPVHAFTKDARLAVLGVIALHHTHATERFRQPACHFRGDAPALAKDGANCLERLLQNQHKQNHDAKNDQGHVAAAIQQKTKDQQSREQPTHKLHQPRADQVPNALDVVHDARYEHTRSVRIIKAHRRPAHVALHPLAQISDHALRGF